MEDAMLHCVELLCRVKHVFKGGQSSLHVNIFYAVNTGFVMMTLNFTHVAIS